MRPAPSALKLTLRRPLRLQSAWMVICGAVSTRLGRLSFNHCLRSSKTASSGGSKGLLSKTS